MDFYNPFSKECVDALNQAVAYHLHISCVYLGMAYSFVVDKKMPPFARFFESQAEARREVADQFLKHLWKRKGKICPPIHKKPNMNEITTPTEALKLAQELERTLTHILLNLNTRAGLDREADLLRFLTSLIQKQKRNEDYLKCQLTYQEKVERQKHKNIQTEKPSTSSGEGI
ncbi:Ferritin heavy chain B [Lemmus lemmus]